MPAAHHRCHESVEEYTTQDRRYWNHCWYLVHTYACVENTQRVRTDCARLSYFSTKNWSVPSYDKHCNTTAQWACVTSSHHIAGDVHCLWRSFMRGPVIHQRTEKRIDAAWSQHTAQCTTCNLTNLVWHSINALPSLPQRKKNGDYFIITHSSLKAFDRW